MRSKFIITAAVASSLLFTNCDDGRIYPPDNSGEELGFRVVMTGTLTGTPDYGSGYSLVLAVFGEGDDFAEVSKGVDPSSTFTDLSNVAVAAGTIELCVVNSLRKRVMTLASVPVEAGPGETVNFDVGAVDISPYGVMADRIFATTCLQCHGGTSHAAASLDLNKEKAWAMLVNVPSRVVKGMMRVAPGDAENSTLRQAVATDASATWSFNHTNLLTSGQIGFIENWIDKGAEK